ncbi:hypothetical protein ABW21_db0206550 [Orbilia brochopaga]|nr:hypothetical protein ABW21_db0206550 [Drechslerella brochopaga]
MASGTTQEFDNSNVDLPVMDRKASVAHETARSIIAENFSQHEDDGVLEEGSLDPRYRAKATILNAAMQELGFGSYQR